MSKEWFPFVGDNDWEQVQGTLASISHALLAQSEPWFPGGSHCLVKIPRAVHLSCTKIAGFVYYFHRVCTHAHTHKMETWFQGR